MTKIQCVNLGRYLQMDLHWMFSLIARLSARDPSTDAFRVLNTYQAVEAVEEVTAIIAGLVAAFWPGANVWDIPLAILFGDLLGLVLVRSRGFPLLSRIGLLALGRLQNLLPTFGVHAAIMGVLFVRLGWLPSLLWLGGSLGTIGVVSAVEFIWTLRRCRRMRAPISASAANFLQAYRLHASKLGVTTDVFLSESESNVQSVAWQECADKLFDEFPGVEHNFFRADNERWQYDPAAGFLGL